MVDTVERRGAPKPDSTVIFVDDAPAQMLMHRRLRCSDLTDAASALLGLALLFLLYGFLLFWFVRATAQAIAENHKAEYVRQ